VLSLSSSPLPCRHGCESFGWRTSETLGFSVFKGLAIIILLVVVASCGDNGPTQPEGTIAVSVRADGSGVAGVTVSLQGPASMTASTDSNGITTFQALGAGTYTVSISGFPDDHYFPDTSGSATLESGGSASVSFQGNRLEITTASLPRGMVGAEYSAPAGGRWRHGQLCLVACQRQSSRGAQPRF
jgi:hypothetical protein